jgi:hypothetical protein
MQRRQAAVGKPIDGSRGPRGSEKQSLAWHRRTEQNDGIWLQRALSEATEETGA